MCLTFTEPRVKQLTLTSAPEARHHSNLTNPTDWASGWSTLAEPASPSRTWWACGRGRVALASACG
jgi:hypothetical protein